MPDESELSYSTFARALINRALGADGYYGVFTANIHTDRPVGPAEEIIAEAQAAGVPVITAAQLLDWTEGRNSSQFQNVGYGNGLLRFTVAPGAGARGLEAMLPASAANGALNSLTRNGQQVARETRTVKGITYHVFAAAAGNYEAYVRRARRHASAGHGSDARDRRHRRRRRGRHRRHDEAGHGRSRHRRCRWRRRRRRRRRCPRGPGGARPLAHRARVEHRRAEAAREVLARRVALPRDAAHPPQRQADRHPPDRDHRAGRDQDGRVQAQPQRAARPLQCRLIPGRRNRNHPLGGGFPRDHQEQDQAAGASALGGGPVAIKEDAVPRGVLTTTCAAALAALAVVTPSAVAAPGTFPDPDFAGASSEGTEVTTGSARLKRGVLEEFTGAALPTGMTATQWAPPAGGATVSGGNLVVDGARVVDDPVAAAPRVLEFRAQVRRRRLPACRLRGHVQ